MTMLPVRYEKDCRTRDYQHYFDDVSQFCAGFKGAVEIGLCSGDSGKTAFIHAFGKWQQVGIVSWVNYCGFPDEYTYFSKIQEFRQWIVEESNKLSIY
jgi:secreted trypsin-like serine protease